MRELTGKVCMAQESSSPLLPFGQQLLVSGCHFLRATILAFLFG